MAESRSVIHNNKSTPLVSVIMPMYNAERFVQEAIESVIRQTLVSWEMIIVDDSSTDQSLNIVNNIQAIEPRIKVLTLTKNSGAAVARNMALQKATGRYIAFLDCDDLWLPEKLEKQIKFMQDEGCVFSFTSYEKIDENNVAIGAVGVPPQVTYEELLKTCVIGCLTAIYDTRVFGKVLMPNVRRRQDFGLWLKLLKKTEYACGISDVLAKYRVYDGSISSNKFRASLSTWRLYRDVENLGIVRSTYYFTHYAIKGALRSWFPGLAVRLGVLQKAMTRNQ